MWSSNLYPFKKEIAMFWAGLVVGLILGIPLGILVFSSMVSAKRSQDALDQAVSAMELTPVPSWEIGD
jgi:ABC-type nitrate/sulfonate/bicarbonate transport system permease component